MCGIAGIAVEPGREVHASALEALAAALRHRGPDDHATWIDTQAGLGLTHNRLSILDLSAAGRQPMLGPGGHVLAFNGEVYNFAALRTELEAAGRVFCSRTDSEVVLQACELWGASALVRLQGMFALAWADPVRRRLLLARDPLGMKPLYYTPLPAGGGIMFASEIKAFLALPGFRARLDREALAQYLELGYTYDLHGTCLEGVRKLPPGHVLIVERGHAGAPERFYQPPQPDPSDVRTLDARVDELHGVLTEVVGQHLVADVPVGLLLSGGLDSSVLAALAARHGRLRTLTMAFTGARFDEREPARAVAAAIGSTHEELLFSPEELHADLEDAVACVDDLFADWGVLSTRLVYQRARARGLKVVLVGEGSDELFGGYDVFAQPPGPLAIARLYRRYAVRRYGRGYFRFRRAFRACLSEAKGDMFHAVRLFELRHQLPNNYVMKVDKGSMAASVEARAPYLDVRVADVALRTPRRFLLAGGTNKRLLRELALRLLPEDVARRAKFGGSIAANWIAEVPDFRRFARAHVLAPRGWADALGLRDPMQRFFDHGQSGYAFPRALSIFEHLAWRLLLLSLWSRRLLGADAAEAWLAESR